MTALFQGLNPTGVRAFARTLRVESDGLDDALMSARTAISIADLVGDLHVIARLLDRAELMRLVAAELSERGDVAEGFVLAGLEVPSVLGQSLGLRGAQLDPTDDPPDVLGFVDTVGPGDLADRIVDLELELANASEAGLPWIHLQWLKDRQDEALDRLAQLTGSDPATAVNVALIVRIDKVNSTVRRAANRGDHAWHQAMIDRRRELVERLVFRSGISVNDVPDTVGRVDGALKHS